MDFANGFHLTQHIGPNYLGGQLDSDARTAIHMSHRLGALVLTLVLLLLAWQLRRAGLARLAGLLLLALGVQISLGIGNVIFHLPLVLAVAHNAGGALLLLTLVLVNYRVRLNSRRSQLAVVRHSGDPVVRQGNAGTPDPQQRLGVPLAPTGQ
jgi:cytochrome c oxidase assembly protein subunit 15